jgi:hypothetical protein
MIVSYAKNLSHHSFLEMEESIERAHRLFKKKNMVWDQLYMLKIINYGELQKSYKSEYNE